MLKFKRKKQFIYLRGVNCYINTSNISRLYYDSYRGIYKIELNYTLNTAHSSNVVSYTIDKSDYDKLINLTL